MALSMKLYQLPLKRGIKPSGKWFQTECHFTRGAIFSIHFKLVFLDRLFWCLKYDFKTILAVCYCRICHFIKLLCRPHPDRQDT